MIIGLTGGICTGKSIASDALRGEGLRIIDCDEIAHYLSSYSPRVLEEIRRNFGPEFFRHNGALDRPALAQTVFADAVRRSDLEHILHPPIWEVVEDNIAFARRLRQPLVVVVPLLFETRRVERFDQIWVISASRENQLTRLMQRAGLTREQAELRIDAQLPGEEKEKLADLVIRNDASLEEFRVEILKHWRRIYEQTS